MLNRAHAFLEKHSEEKIIFMENKAVLLSKLDRDKEAFEKYNEVAQIKTENLGKYHESTIRSI